MITKQNFKNIAEENIWWHGPSFLINNTKFNENLMQPEILLESDIDIQNQSNVCLTFRCNRCCKHCKIQITVKTEANYCFYVSLYRKFRTKGI